MKSIDTDNLLSEPGVRFGRTVVVATADSLFAHQVDAVVCPANSRGMMGVGLSGLVRAEGGADIERELMERAPMTPGTAEVTGSGKLIQRGTRGVIHAVVADTLGSPSREKTIRDAITEVLEAADEHRYRSLAMPILMSGQRSSMIGSETIALAMIEEIVAYLRRFTSRLDRIVLICHDDREARILEHALADARRMRWGLQM